MRLLEASPAVERVEWPPRPRRRSWRSAAARLSTRSSSTSHAGLDGSSSRPCCRGSSIRRPSSSCRCSTMPPSTRSSSRRVDYLRKPVSRQRLDEAIERAAARARRRAGAVEDETLAVDVLRGGGTRCSRARRALPAGARRLRARGQHRGPLPRARAALRLEERWAGARLPARASRLRGQPAARGRGPPAAERHCGARHGRRRRGPDRPPPGRRPAPEAGRVSERTPRDELAEATAHGGLYLRRLIRAQLGLTTVALVASAASSEPCRWRAPAARTCRTFVLGVPLPIFIIAWPPFPLFIAIAMSTCAARRRWRSPSAISWSRASDRARGDPGRDRRHVGLGLYGVRLARTTSDLFVASRAITPWWNAAAISGEYLSAASFLGIAGLQMKLGTGALWLRSASPPATSRCCCSSPRCCALRRLHALRLRRGAAALAADPRAGGRRGAADRRLVPRAAAQGRGPHAGRGHRRPGWVGVVVVGAVVALNVASAACAGSPMCRPSSTG